MIEKIIGRPEQNSFSKKEALLVLNKILSNSKDDTQITLDVSNEENFKLSEITKVQVNENIINMESFISVLKENKIERGQYSLLYQKEENLIVLKKIRKKWIQINDF